MDQHYDIVWGEDLSPAILNVNLGADGVILDVIQEGVTAATQGLDIDTLVDMVERHQEALAASQQTEQEIQAEAYQLFLNRTIGEGGKTVMTAEQRNHAIGNFKLVEATSIKQYAGRIELLLDLMTDEQLQKALDICAIDLKEEK